jgi:squalene synthase HpnC
MGQARRENFPVASLLLPRRVRAHLLAVYGYARLVDDVGDEVSGDRLALLDEIEADLDRLWDGGPPQHPLIARLAPAVAEYGLPPDPFKKLIEANRRDQAVHRYASFAELESYCQLSANPVGELVLRIFEAATEERLALSDKVCTALQLAEHWQDVAEDFAAGRIYLPGEDRERFGVRESDLAGTSAPPELRALMAFEVDRARELLNQGAPLAATLRGRASFAVRAFVAGGRSALQAIERADYDVLASTPRAGRAERARQLVLALTRGRRR